MRYVRVLRELRMLAELILNIMFSILKGEGDIRNCRTMKFFDHGTMLVEGCWKENLAK